MGQKPFFRAKTDERNLLLYLHDEDAEKNCHLGRHKLSVGFAGDVAIEGLLGHQRAQFGGGHGARFVVHCLLCAGDKSPFRLQVETTNYTPGIGFVSDSIRHFLGREKIIY